MRISNLLPAWSSDDINDIVFENRNKVYGAYELRKHYPQRLKKSLIICTSTCLMLFGAYSYFLQHHHKISEYVPVTHDSIYIDENIYVVVGEPAPQEKAEPEKVITDETPKVLVNDSLVNDSEKTDTSDNAVSSSGIQDGDGIPSSNYSDGPSTSPATGSENAIPSELVGDDEFTPSPSVWPTYPGGQKALTRYLQKHLNCPHLNSNAKGKMHLSFIIGRNGEVKEVKILRDNVGFGCAEEAARVLQKMPRWSPGLNNHHPVNVKMIIPISIENEQ